MSKNGARADGYHALLARRASKASPIGRRIRTDQLHASLKPFQRRIVTWACEVGRPAVWADTGLGKTRMQIEWARHMADRSLIIAPLAVAQQTVEEAARVGVAATYVRSQPTGAGLFVTNYEMLDKFDPATFQAVALDESSILKQSDGKTRKRLIQWAESIPFRSSWSATPAPNDPEELTNQAEFLGHMTRTNMLAAYFVHDQDGWRLKGHAYQPMIDWLATWAVALRKPGDLGCPDDSYALPGLRIIPEIVEVEIEAEEGALFATDLGGVSGRSKVRRASLDARVERAVDLVRAEPTEPWLLWCGLNGEADALAASIPGAVNVHGGMDPDAKADALMAFAHGDTQVLITKPRIAAFGLNYQHCARMAFVGLSDSYEQYYQSIRRCYRFGQERVVHAHIVLSEPEREIAANVAGKERQANRVIDGLIAAWGRA